MSAKRNSLVKSTAANLGAAVGLAGLFVVAQPLWGGGQVSFASAVYWIVACSLLGLANQALSTARARRTDQSIHGPVLDAIRTLGGALSSFGSGNLISKVDPAPLAEAAATELPELMAELESCRGEFNGITAPISRRLCFSGCNSYQEGQVSGRGSPASSGEKARFCACCPASTKLTMRYGSGVA